MELIKLFRGAAKEDIDKKCIIKNTFFVDKMEPLCFIVEDTTPIISIIFCCTQNSTEEEIYLRQLVQYDDKSKQDNLYIKLSKLNFNNCNPSQDRFIKYAYCDKQYSCDFDMVECKNKFGFQDAAYRFLDKDNNHMHYEKLDLFFAREIYIQYNIFMQDFINRINIDNYKKFCKKIPFTTIEHVRIDDISCEQFIKDFAVIHTQYTIGNGPELYKFENKFGIDLEKDDIPEKIFNITINYPGFRLCYDKVNTNMFIYGAIYNDINDCLYLIYCDKFNGKEKFTVLRLFKDMYNKTNLIDKYNIIKKENKDHEESVN